MKKLFFPSFICVVILAACNNSKPKGQDMKRDSIASYKTSKATDTTKPIKPGSDSSYTHHNSPESIADSVKHR